MQLTTSFYKTLPWHSVCCFVMAPATDPIPDEIRRQLGAGEQVLWHGRPRQGLLLRQEDAFYIPFSLAWAGLAMRMQAASGRGDPVAGLFLLVGAYITVGRFVADAWVRTRIHYAVTGERILIVSGIFVHTVKSLNLAGLAELRLAERRSGEGTIVFGSERPLPAFGGRWSSLVHGPQLPPPRFEAIPDASTVHALIRNAQRTLCARR